MDYFDMINIIIILTFLLFYVKLNNKKIKIVLSEFIYDILGFSKIKLIG